ncbi:MAG TPA: hypothetical protein VM939_06100 [Gemmatimonadaceae bacterium]|nr:hypothetical protein [Gemmatimonadaceae bacterium]
MQLSLAGSRTAIATLVLAGLATGCDSPAAPLLPPPSDANFTLRTDRAAASEAQLFATIRAVTAKYHNVEAAIAAGYVNDEFGCVSDPTLGAMGVHYINFDIDADPSIDPLTPELLVYEPGKDGKLKLVALEYEVFQADWYGAGNTQPPSLFGEEFEAVDFPGLPPLFALHVWVWRNNKAGMFADWNARVSCDRG